MLALTLSSIMAMAVVSLRTIFVEVSLGSQTVICGSLILFSQVASMYNE